MSRSIALLSGKGGSGKTTLALTLANMLSSCKLRVLLVDCDLVTNGATYFYEDRLNQSASILSFDDLLYKTDGVKQSTPIKISPYYDFIPSILRVSEGTTISRHFDIEIKKRFESIYHDMTKKYDAILFDCSAGYSEVLQYVVPLTDCNLVVLEADTISMAAMRSLYLKIGEILPNSRFYQVFNKIRPEEVEVYSRKEGSFFTNIGAVTFDWSIREAFSMASVPTVDNTGLEFGMQLYRICSTLFQGETYQSKLNTYSLELSLNKARVERDQTQIELINYRSDRQSWRDRRDALMYTLIPMFFLCVMCAFLLYSNHFESKVSLPLLVTVTVSLLISLFSYMQKQNRDNRERKMKLTAYSDRLDALKEKIEYLEQKINETK